MPHEYAGYKPQLLQRGTLFCSVYIARKSRFLSDRKGFKKEVAEQIDASQHGAFAPCSKRPSGSKPAVSDPYPGSHFSGEVCAVKRAGRSPDG